MTRPAAALALAAAGALAGCASEAPPRPQLVLVVDTDAPVTGQVLQNPIISPDAVVDTVRVDVFDEAGNAYDYRDFIAPDASDWPISFGVAAPEGGGGRVNLRVRVFRGALATSELLGGAAVLEPRKEIAVDRVVELDLPEEGVRTALVRLSFDCMGVAPSFVAPRTTCTDAARPEAPATEGIIPLKEGEIPETLVGAAARAFEIPCAAPGSDSAACIPGGFSILGDPALWGIADGLFEDALPLRPAVVSPFLLDRTEVTVGRFRALLAAGAAIPELPQVQDPADENLKFCSFLGPDNAENDALPLSCVSWETAAAICAAAGGALPTEAQWEHAARGRGQGRTYPWGDAGPACCAASASRASRPDIAVECAGAGPEPVGSHPASEACGGLGDVSRDGVLDLAGSVSEWLRDKLRPFKAACWGSGILVDPVCEDDAVSAHAARGGSWPAGMATTLSALRRAGTVSPADGLRCAYPVAP